MGFVQSTEYRSIADIGPASLRDWTLSANSLPRDLLMPAISRMMSVLARVVHLVAWIRCSTDEYRARP